MREPLTWIGIAFCITQSAMFSGLNLAFFSVSRLRLKALQRQGNRDAEKVLRMRRDSNFLLTTILWGNVGINVLLTLLSNSVLAGVGSFLFSTVVITAFGEIVPQAYFSRHALRMASLLAPALRIYQFVLFPVAKPTAWLLDLWLGKEGAVYFREKEFREIIREHIEVDNDIGTLEGKGAINFLAIDDIAITQEGVPVARDSVVALDFKDGKPCFPDYLPKRDDPFLKKINGSREKWVVLTDETSTPRFVLDADGFLRDVFLDEKHTEPRAYCHKPVVIKDATTILGEIIPLLRVEPEHAEDDVIDKDIILLWGKERRVITGADILGRLMRGIVPKSEG